MNFKKYLPFENYVLTTKLPAEEVYKRLDEKIALKKTSFFSFSNFRSSLPYEGSLGANYFKISRVIYYRNSFLPVIKGEFSPTTRGTEIHINMQPEGFVMVFISLWLGVVTLVCLGELLIGIVKFRQIIQQGFPPAALIPFGMLLFACLMTYFGFKLESKKSKKFLVELLDAEEIPSPD
jgi:hypothetical protein